MAYQRQGSLAEVTKGGAGDLVQALQQFLPNIGLNINDYYGYQGLSSNPDVGEGAGSMALNPALNGLLDGYTFGRTPTGQGGSMWDVMQGGNMVGSYRGSDDNNFLDKIGPYGPLLVLGGGLMAGGLGGAAGGAAAGGSAAGGGAMGLGDAIAAAGSATTPAAVGGGAAAAGAAGAGGLLSGLKGAVGTAAGAMGLTPGQMVGGGLGLLAGMDATKDQKQTSMQKMDPRMDAMVYGQGGLLPMAQQWFQGAQNSPAMGLMNQGMQQMGQFYGSPQYGQQFGQLRDTGLGLLGRPMAQNPFMKG